MQKIKIPQINKFMAINSIVFLVFAIWLSIFYYTPITANSWIEKLAQHIAAVIIYFFLMLWISRVFTLWKKDIDSTAYKIRASIWSLIAIVFLVFISYNSLQHEQEKKEKEDIMNIVNSISLDKDWNVNFKTNIDLKSDNWKKVIELFEWMYEETFEFNNKMKEYENLMYAKDAFTSTWNIQKSIDAHQEAIEYLSNFSKKWFEEVEQKIDTLFGDDETIKSEIKQKLKKDYDEMLEKEKVVNEAKLELFDKSLELHKYYFENYDKLIIWENWNPILKEDDKNYNKLYKEYEKVYDEYTKAYSK